MSEFWLVHPVERVETKGFKQFFCVTIYHIDGDDDDAADEDSYVDDITKNGDNDKDSRYAVIFTIVPTLFYY